MDLSILVPGTEVVGEAAVINNQWGVTASEVLPQKFIIEWLAGLLGLSKMGTHRSTIVLTLIPDSKRESPWVYENDVLEYSFVVQPSSFGQWDGDLL